jgi:nucleoside-diphosphate-sugar epimerase
VVGDGDNRYQFISAQDLIDAMLLAAEYAGSDLFGVGSDNPLSLKQIYQYVIDSAKSGSRICPAPKGNNARPDVNRAHTPDFAVRAVSLQNDRRRLFLRHHQDQDQTSVAAQAYE